MAHPSRLTDVAIGMLAEGVDSLTGSAVGPRAGL
jgi:hypothetical protein